MPVHTPAKKKAKANAKSKAKSKAISKAKAEKVAKDKVAAAGAFRKPRDISKKGKKDGRRTT